MKRPFSSAKFKDIFENRDLKKARRYLEEAAKHTQKRLVFLKEEVVPPTITPVVTTPSAQLDKQNVDAEVIPNTLSLIEQQMVEMVPCTPTPEFVNNSPSQDLAGTPKDEAPIIEIIETQVEPPALMQIEEPSKLSHLIDIASIAHLDSSFPDREFGGMYKGSDMQLAILKHMQEQRKIVKHKLGLIVVATGLGKTILAILDLQQEIEWHLQNSSTTDLSFNITMKSITREDASKPKGSKLILRRRTKPVEQAPVTKTGAEKKPFKFLFLVHSKAIRDTTYIKFQEHFSDFGFSSAAFLSVDSSNAIESSSWKTSQFIFCLFQSFDRIPEHVQKTFTHVLIDECHHLLASTYNKCFDILRKSEVLHYMLGMTATLRHRTDPKGENLKLMFEGVVYVDLPWTTAKQFGYFPAVEYIECLPTLQEGRDIETYAQIRSSYLNQHRDINKFLGALERSLNQLGMKKEAQLKAVLTSSFIVETLLKYQAARESAGLPQKKKIIIFAPGCDSADQIALLLQQKFSDKNFAAAVHYKISSTASKETLKNFASGKIKVLCNVNMLNEGYDVTDIDLVVLAKNTKSELVFVQQMGRGLRKNKHDPNKEVCIMDLALNLRRRWKLLMADLPPAALEDLVRQFWDVQNFVGLL